MFKRYLWVVIFLFSIVFAPLNTRAQKSNRSRAFFVEALGPGVFGSVNYDFRLRPVRDGLGVRIGAGMIPDVLVFPLEINGLTGKKRLAFEYGLGTTAGLFLKEKPGDQTFSSGISGLGFIGYGKAGLRWRPENKGFMFSFNWTPMINTEEVWIAWFGLGIGYYWRK